MTGKPGGKHSHPAFLSHPVDGVAAQNIILAGFMGSGKSTVGRILARHLGWKFCDTDKMIERQAGLSVAEIFEALGEPAFRDMESELAERLAIMRRCVIATGGGFLVRPQNREAAARAGDVFLLMASPERIWHRVGRSGHRPLLKTADPMSRIRELLKEREAAYAAIPNRVETDDLTPEAVAGEILNRLQARR